MDSSPGWDGALNLSDLGDLARRDGSRTATGRVYRSGRVERITAAGWSHAQSDGLATVIDLRNDNEIGRRADDPSPEGMHRTGIHFAHQPVEDQENEAFMKRWGDALAHSRYYPAALDFFPELIGFAMTTIAKAPPSILIHCSAGRDRTGLITALLLRLTDVTTDAIVDDYEAAVRRYNQALAAQPAGWTREQAKTEAELVPAIAERRDALSPWIDQLDVADYLHHRAGLPRSIIERLSTLLDPAA
jgi:protein tyrosine/serine phosphatase